MKVQVIGLHYFSARVLKCCNTETDNNDNTRSDENFESFFVIQNDTSILIM